jgi:CubicO group peptidase (beta-lactamase class C family)
MLLTAAAIALLVSTGLAQQKPGDLESKVDQVFARWTTSTPGCAVGVGLNGQTVLSKAYGMADLEHDVRNTAETIFEAGSVSKQFTAAAVLLLARDGKLSLDDPVRKYVPELPDYGAPLTIRHMLNHTSGLRDWGGIAAIAGWPRGSRTHTHAHVLEIVSRQRALNFTPGTRWSYTNTGYNLAAIIVARVSGTSFAEFSKQRIFQPLAMTRTSWRDDYTRIVRGRATAYAQERDGFRIQMPFENVHGNGGLLTTVGDLLKWNENFAHPVMGDGAFVAEQQRPGRFNDGRAHRYALGLFIETYKGVPRVSHDGATAGYRAFLARYPDQRASVALLCNDASANATQLGLAVTDLYLADRLKMPAAPGATHTLTSAEREAVLGQYRGETGIPLSISRADNGVRVDRGGPLIPLTATRFVTGNGQTWDFDGRGTIRVTDAFGTVETYARAGAPTTSLDALRELTGPYHSDDAETTIVVAVDGDALVLRRRPDSTVRLTPVYADAFIGPSGLVIFRRDAAGHVTELSLVQDRVWDLRFAKRPLP